ncbi:MAG: hypothetical protein MJY78_01860 [Fibrobacter sp.]|nr:hypothetical protein [Fibrobacter sp.]
MVSGYIMDLHPGLFDNGFSGLFTGFLLDEFNDDIGPEYKKTQYQSKDG